LGIERIDFERFDTCGDLALGSGRIGVHRGEQPVIRFEQLGAAAFGKFNGAAINVTGFVRPAEVSQGLGTRQKRARRIAGFRQRQVCQVKLQTGPRTLFLGVRRAPLDDTLQRIDAHSGIFDGAEKIFSDSATKAQLGPTGHEPQLADLIGAIGGVGRWTLDE
jgi:hypothetical protein